MNKLEKLLEIIRVSDPDIYNLLSDNFEFVADVIFTFRVKFKSNRHKVIALLALEQYMRLYNQDKWRYEIPLNLPNFRICMYPNTDNTMSVYIAALNNFQ